MCKLLLTIAVTLIPLSGAGAITLRDDLHSNVARGNRYYAAGENDKALQRYNEAQGLDSTSAVPHFNAGDAQYRLGNFKDGALEFLKSAGSETDSIKAMSYYNLGNTMFKAGDLQSAAEAYKRSLLIDPEDQDAKYNLELALKMMDEQQNQQQNQDQKQQQDKDQQDQQQKGGQQEQQEQEQSQQQNKQQNQDQEQQQNQQAQNQENRQEQQEQDHENQAQQQEQQASQESQQAPEISPEELQRILAAIEASDKETQEAIIEQASRRKTSTGKDW
jgi:Ca-activated chloride channel family protein